MADLVRLLGTEQTASGGAEARDGSPPGTMPRNGDTRSGP